MHIYTNKHVLHVYMCFYPYEKQEEHIYICKCNTYNSLIRQITQFINGQRTGIDIHPKKKKKRYTRGQQSNEKMLNIIITRDT